jgi:transcriptional regulator with XRE-family HTH domain
MLHLCQVGRDFGFRQGGQTLSARPKKEVTSGEFVAWLRKEMAERRLSQSEMGRRANILPSVISRWLAGEYGPDPGSCLKIANALGVDPQYVMSLAGHSPRQRIPEDMDVQYLMSALRYIDWSKPGRMSTVRGIFRMYQDEDNIQRVAEDRPKAQREA